MKLAPNTIGQSFLVLFCILLIKNRNHGNFQRLFMRVKRIGFYALCIIKINIDMISRFSHEKQDQQTQQHQNNAQLQSSSFSRHHTPALSFCHHKFCTNSSIKKPPPKRRLLSCQ